MRKKDPPPGTPNPWIPREPEFNLSNVLFDMLNEVPEAGQLKEALFRYFNNDKELVLRWMTTYNNELGSNPSKRFFVKEFDHVLKAFMNWVKQGGTFVPEGTES